MTTIGDHVPASMGLDLDMTHTLDWTFRSRADASTRADAGDERVRWWPDIAAGTRVYHYEIIREIGRGGMGAVYLARDTRLGRRVAIKFLFHKQADGNERFLAEARVTARCVHENIVEIHDVNQYGDMPFMVLEYLSGESLARLLTGVPLPPGRAVEIMIPVVRALVCAHAHGIVHRDLKPENIIITDAGTIKVLDFGIAKLLSQEEEVSWPESVLPLLCEAAAPGSTIRGERSSGVGTVPYMSPEQWGAGEVDHRTDIWAVGIMLYIMVTGRHPLEPLRAGGLASAQLLDEPMPDVHAAGVAVPDELAQVIDRCLIKSRERRMGSAQELLAALEPLAPGRSGRAIADGACPFAGLAAFQEADADRFFGRSRDIAAVVGRVRDQPLIGIVGPSGVGKSSFIRAGVIPALKRSDGTWDALVVRPGRHPLAALAQALLAAEGQRAPADGDAGQGALDLLIERLRQEPGLLGAWLRRHAHARARRILLFVDQLEELYTLVADADERAAFTASLLGVADDTSAPLRVILSIRSDFLDRAAEDRRFMSELTHGLCFLPPPDRVGLREALVQPLAQAGYAFSSDEMIEHMLDALESTPGALPLLQFTAGVLWEARDRARRLLTDESYARIGGVAGALAGHADAVLHGLPTAQQRLAQALFRRLVTLERTRDIVPLCELRSLAANPGEIEPLVRYFVDARLLVIHRGDEVNSPLVELVHESLITRWPSLRRWLDENQEAAAFLADLRAAARQWRMRGRSPGLLWRGDAVDSARRWRELCADEMSDAEREYLAAALTLADRSARVRRRLIAGTMAFLVALVAAAAVALVTIQDAGRKAQREAERAREAERLAQAQNEQITRNERRIREQLEEIQAERRAAAAAEKKARVASDLTALTRLELIDALHAAKEALALAERKSRRASAEARRARRATAESRKAMELAQRAADAEKQTREKLQKLLREREQRIQRLERESGGVAEGPLR